MIERKCDRCHKIIGALNYYTCIIDRMAMVSVTNLKYDLCPECRDDVVKYIEKEQENGN